MLPRAIRTVLRELGGENGVAAPPPSDAYSIERAYTAICRDLNEYRSTVNELRRQVERYHDRAEQVFSWLARFEEDLKRAMDPELRKRVEEVRTGLSRSAVARREQDVALQSHLGPRDGEQ